MRPSTTPELTAAVLVADHEARLRGAEERRRAAEASREARSVRREARRSRLAALLAVPRRRARRRPGHRVHSSIA
ncbi:hypothetical protein [Nocardioides sp. GXQ0305]|uniref:hypothetical protein n=1 Tax=Nocardioides sp. GXQ0305 TaxID=3423912 RepID=UPI003D7D0A6F